MKHYPIVLILLIYHSTLLTGKSQFELNETFQDSIIRVSGHVYDSATQEALSDAVISYEELPYGNTIGIITSDDLTGYYEFYTKGDDGYRIEVKADHYETIVNYIYPIRDASGGELKQNYYMQNIPEPGEVIKLDNLIFDLGKSEIKPGSFEELDRLVQQMTDYPEMVIQLEGHTDFRGGQSQNFRLSEDRVKKVKEYLVRKGIKENRILTKAFGGSNPVSREASEEAARLNRRVEVRIIKR